PATLRTSPPRSPPFPYTTLFRSDRRGVREPRPDRSLRRGEPVRPELAIRGVEGGGRPPGACLSRDLRPPDSRHELFEQLRPLPRSEEHTSELQSRVELVCRLLLE